MIRKEIELKSMYSLGACRALVTDNSVSIKAYGIAGCLKAWLTGKSESLELGNLVNGSIEKRVDTSGYNGILITQSGRQMFYGRFISEEEEKSKEKEICEEMTPKEACEETKPKEEHRESCGEMTPKEEPKESCKEATPEEEPKEYCGRIIQNSEPSPDKILSFNDGYSWRKITDRSFPSDSLSVRYILSHRSFYNSFLLHGKYFYGEKDNNVAVAIECDIKNEPHPFPNLSGFSVLRDGYMIICANTVSKNFCEYEY